MKTRVQRLGDGLAICIPNQIADEIVLREDTDVELDVQNGVLTLRPVPNGQPSLTEFSVPAGIYHVPMNSMSDSELSASIAAVIGEAAEEYRTNPELTAFHAEDRLHHLEMVASMRAEMASAKSNPSPSAKISTNEEKNRRARILDELTAESERLNLY